MHAPPAVLHFLDPWKELYSNSKEVDTGVTFVHVVALLFGGGAAVVADRATLRVRDFGSEAARRALGDLHASHRLVLIALSISVVSGIGLACADLETFLASPIFAIKLVLVALLLINGAVLTTTETALTASDLDPQRTTPLWRRLHLVSRLSLTLWSATVLAGTALVNMV